MTLHPTHDAPGLAPASSAEGEARFRSAFDHATIGKALVARDGAWLEVNPALCRFLGHTESELLRMTFQDITHPDDVDADVALVQEMLDGTRASYQMEKRYLHKEGHVVWALLSVSAVCDEDGGVRYFISEIQDVTALKRAERDLANTERRYYTLVEQSLTGIYVVQDERLVYANTHLADLIGCTPDDVVGHPLWDFVLDEDRPLMQEQARRRTAGEVEEVRYVVRLRHRDGSIVHAEVHGGMGLYNGEAAFTGAVVDVSQRVRAEEARRRQEEYYRALVRNASDVVTVLEADGTIRYESDSVRRVLGYEPAELVGQNAFALFHPDDAAAVMHTFGGVLQQPGQTLTAEARFRHKNGSWRVLSITGTNLLDHPAVEGIVANSRDVTPQVEAERALRQSEQLLSAIFEAADVGVCVTDEHGRFARVNRGYCELYGYAEDELLGQPFTLVLPPEQRAAAQALHDAFIAGEPELPGEWEVLHRDGHTLNVIATAGLVEREDGRRLKVTTVLDITKRKRAERALQASESRFRTLVEQSLVGVYVIQDGRLAYVNEAFADLVGFSASELEGMSPLDLAVEEERAMAQEQIRRRDSGEAESARYVVRVRTKDGRLRRLEVHGVRSEYRGRPAIIGVFVDVTEQEVQTERLAAVVALQQAIAAFRLDEDLDEVLARIAAESSQLTGADGAVIELVEGDELVYRGVSGTAEGKLGLRLRIDTSLSGRCVRTGETVNCADAEHDERVDREAVRKVGVKTMVIVPLTYRGDTFGVLKVFSGTRTHVFNEKHVATLQLVAGQLAAVVSHARAFEVQREREAYYRLLAENMNDLVCLHALDGTYEWVSPSVRGLLGYSPRELVGVAPYTLFHPDDAERIERESHQRLVQGEEAYTSTTYRIRHKDGHWVWLETLTQAILDDEGEVEHLQTASRDVSERHEMEERLVYQAHHDALTGLPNRARFCERLEDVIAEREGEYAVLFLDLDRFKTVNDSLGHTAGDGLLKEVARRLRQELRPCDTVARFGGDEFAVLLRRLPYPEHAEAVAERVGKALNAPVQVEGREIVVGASIGVVTGRPDHDSADALLLEADLAMYDAKKLGRGTYATFSPAAHEAIGRRHQLEMDLRHAADRGQLRAAYQPVVRLTDGALTGFEALVRWEHPEFGLLYPDAFIELAEESGQVALIDRWILEEACRQTTRWREAFDDCPLLVLNVNCSSRDLIEGGYSDHVRRILDAQRFAPDRLLLEITESLLVEDTELAAAELQLLRDRGVRFCIDDFGTGYSSLSTLHALPIDTIKVDRSFVSKMDAHDRRWKLVETVVRLGRILDKSVVAEGIETPAQLDALRRMGCDCGQGYLFARPLTPEAATALIAADVLPWAGHWKGAPEQP